MRASVRIQAAGETIEKAIERATFFDQDGNALYRASKFAKGPEIEGDTEQDAVAPPPKKLGPAGIKMEALARDNMKANPRKSKESAYAHVFADPANSALRRQVLHEEMTQIASEHSGAEDRGVSRDAEEDKELAKAALLAVSKVSARHMAFAATLSDEGKGDFLSMTPAERDKFIAANPDTDDLYNGDIPATKRAARRVIYRVADIR